MAESDNKASVALRERGHLRRLTIVRERFGEAGVRDPDFLCREFEPGNPGPGECESDGHYMCAECVHFIGEHTR